MSFVYRIARAVSHAAGSNSAAVRFVRPISERLLRFLAGRRGMRWEINGVQCRINPRFRSEFARSYDAGLAALLKKEVRPGQVCLDIGANIGVWVIQFAHLVGPTGRVVAFEPNPRARAILEEHIRLNALESIVSVVPLAVGSMPGDVTLYAAGYDGMSRIGAPNPQVAKLAQPITVPLVTIDDWCRDNDIHPDWLFIDIEGFEGHALAGARETIRSAGTGLGIIVEMHPNLWQASGSTRDEVAARIAAVGRKPTSLTGQPDPFAEYGHVRLDPL